MKVSLLASTKDCELLCAVAANTCYSSEYASGRIKSMTKDEANQLLRRVLASHHESVIEHANYTFSIEGVSRALTHQLVRHRLMSFSQQSQRYVNMEEADYVTPPSILNNEDALDLFEGMMSDIWQVYDRLVKMGIANEDARFVLPNACTTNITFTANARQLRHVLELRCCNRAQWEIREVALKMLELLKAESPIIFGDAGPACLRGPCPEGKRTCGHPWVKVKTD